MNLKALFFDAFASRPRPPTARILRAEVSDYEGAALRELLAARTPTELSAQEIRDEVGSNLWMLTTEAFLYFLPAFMHACLESYAFISVFASELVGALTEPSRTDVVESLDRLAQVPPGLGLPQETAELLRRQQLEWFDSGWPSAIFREHFESLTQAEGGAILAFLVAMQEAHGGDFPFGQLQVAIDRHWARYRAP